MPTLILKSAENYRNAIRPAILDSINYLLDIHGVNEKDLLIYLNGDSSGARPINSDKDSRRRSGQFTDFISRKKLFCVAEITNTEFNSGYGNLGRQLNNPPLWQNDSCRTYVVPVFEGCRISVDCNAHFKTRQQAENFRSFLQRSIDLQPTNPSFSAHIHYPVPYEFVLLSHHLQEVEKSSTVPPTKELDFTDWFISSCTAPTAILTNAAGENPIFGIKRRIDHVELILDEPTIQRTRKDGEVLGHYEVSFRYWFHWNQLIQWRVEYPMMINQNPISETYLPESSEVKLDPYNVNTTFEYQAADALKGFHGTKKHLYSRYPLIDGWFPIPNHHRLFPKLVTMLVINNKDEQIQRLGNIKDIPDLKWNPTILKFILKYHDLVTLKSRAPIYLQLYSDDRPVQEDNIRLDRNGDLWLLHKPVIENTYRMVISLDSMLGLLSLEDKGLILTDDFYKKELMPTIFPWWNWVGSNTPPQVGWEGPDKPVTGWVTPGKPGISNKDNPIETISDLELIIEQIDALPEFPSTPSFMMNMSLVAK